MTDVLLVHSFGLSSLSCFVKTFLGIYCLSPTEQEGFKDKKKNLKGAVCCIFLSSFYLFIASLLEP